MGGIVPIRKVKVELTQLELNPVNIGGSSYNESSHSTVITIFYIFLLGTACSDWD